MGVPTSTEVRMNDNSQFVESTDLPQKLERHCIATINSTHLFIAGNGQSGEGRKVYLVHVKGDAFEFSSLPPMINERYSAACGTIVDVSTKQANAESEPRLIVAGGPKNVAKTSEIFSFATGKWEKGPNLPRAFEYGGYVSDGEHSLVLIGGQDDNGDLREDIMEYNPQTNQFEFLNGTIETRRQYFSATGVRTQEEC